MKNKPVLLATGIAILLVVGSLFYYGTNQSEPAADRSGEPQKVSILKYSDYQCPTCRVYVPIQQQLKEEFGDLIEIEYRHFPLGGFQYSRLAAHVSEAAREQGKFREMHDLIFEHQQRWSQGGAEEIFFGFAEQLGLDMEQFAADVESEEIQQRVERQRQEGMRRMVNGTPTYFINGQRLQQLPGSYEQFRSIIELYMYRS
ncbi:MAG: DsbA family protein [Balneolaceae bacterium]